MEQAAERGWPVYNPEFLTRVRRKRRGRITPLGVEFRNVKQAQEDAAMQADKGLKEAARKALHLAAIDRRAADIRAKAEAIQNSLLATRAKKIAARVSLQTGFTIAELCSTQRFRELVQARQYVYWLCKKETALSLPQIGRALGGRDHTTILHGVNKFDAALAAGEEWAVKLVGDAQ